MDPYKYRSRIERSITIALNRHYPSSTSDEGPLAYNYCPNPIVGDNGILEHSMGPSEARLADLKDKECSQ